MTNSNSLEAIKNWHSLETIGNANLLATTVRLSGCGQTLIMPNIDTVNNVKNGNSHVWFQQYSYYS